MDETNSENFREELDQATSARLAKVRSMPLDLSRLDRLIQQQIPRVQGQSSQRINRWIRPLRAAAAILVALGIIAAVFYALSGGPVVASPADMAQFHDDLVSGRVSATHVNSIDEANKSLAQQWAQSPQLPNVPQDQVMACCMRSVKNKKVVCVLLSDADGPVTLSVANSTDMKAPPCPVVVRSGNSFHVCEFGQLNMVMTERNGKWICLMGKLSADRLMDLAAGLKF